LNVLYAGLPYRQDDVGGIIAGELGLDLYRIDLSSVSANISVRPKRTSTVSPGWADFQPFCFLTKLTLCSDVVPSKGLARQVRQHRDSLLLQKMEDYEGIVILATNLRKNMDEAFARRMHFTVGSRFRRTRPLSYLAGGVPGEAPLADDVDLTFLASHFKITGGNIKNIALGAAFLAAQDGDRIKMADVIHAARREYQKMGKLCNEVDFAQYFELVRG